RGRTWLPPPRGRSRGRDPPARAHPATAPERGPRRGLAAREHHGPAAEREPADLLRLESAVLGVTPRREHHRRVLGIPLVDDRVRGEGQGRDAVERRRLQEPLRGGGAGPPPPRTQTPT